MLVGIDADERDMTDGVLIDTHYPCPPFCGSGSALIRSEQSFEVRCLEASPAAQ
jgi:hypothetical protein